MVKGLVRVHTHPYAHNVVTQFPIPISVSWTLWKLFSGSLLHEPATYTNLQLTCAFRFFPYVFLS